MINVHPRPSTGISQVLMEPWEGLFTTAPKYWDPPAASALASLGSVGLLQGAFTVCRRPTSGLPCEFVSFIQQLCKIHIINFMLQERKLKLTKIYVLGQGDKAYRYNAVTTLGASLPCYKWAAKLQQQEGTLLLCGDCDPHSARAHNKERKEVIIHSK